MIQLIIGKVNSYLMLRHIKIWSSNQIPLANINGILIFWLMICFVKVYLLIHKIWVEFSSIKIKTEAKSVNGRYVDTSIITLINLGSLILGYDGVS